MSVNIYSFKSIIEQQFHIIKWNPTSKQLERMLNAVLDIDGQAPLSDVLTVILEIYGEPISEMVTEGHDTSKANILLAKLIAIGLKK